MTAHYNYEPYIHDQTSASSTWLIEHFFERGVGYEVFIDDSRVDAEFEYINDTSFNLKFYEKGVLIAKTGKVVVS